ncbi:hypothetical protein [Chromobacterium vaccinii]|nr:hypothetical protein [Chromobacterium vaccinii]QND86827.1 Uncharacterized protein ChrSW_4602 [Chromobacterium vaccinii]QND92058.1 Uncharacterized protein ChrSV_4602 [Chromobacterium vaccinii]SUX30387.1 Uncharacterised protein [Chromobacterium vaccinii]
MTKNRRWIYACGAGGMLLAAACQAGAVPVPTEQPMPHGGGGVVLGPPFQGGSSAAEAARLYRLRVLVHEAAIHCNDPNCPICHPQRRQSAPL